MYSTRVIECDRYLPSILTRNNHKASFLITWKYELWRRPRSVHVLIVLDVNMYLIIGSKEFSFGVCIHSKQFYLRLAAMSAVTLTMFFGTQWTSGMLATGRLKALANMKNETTSMKAQSFEIRTDCMTIIAELAEEFAGLRQTKTDFTSQWRALTVFISYQQGGARRSWMLKVFRKKLRASDWVALLAWTASGSKNCDNYMEF